MWHGNTDNRGEAAKPQSREKNSENSVFHGAKKVGAVKENFEDIIKFVAFDLEDPELTSHLKNAPSNERYVSTTTVEELL